MKLNYIICLFCLGIIYIINNS
ncbi:hypothetical protein [Photobacterium kishitanii]